MSGSRGVRAVRSSETQSLKSEQTGGEKMQKGADPRLRQLRMEKLQAMSDAARRADNAAGAPRPPAIRRCRPGTTERRHATSHKIRAGVAEQPAGAGPSGPGPRLLALQGQGPVVRVTITIDAHKARKKQVKKKLLAKTVVSI